MEAEVRVDSPEEGRDFSDHEACRRYFEKFERIIGHLHKIAIEEDLAGAEESFDQLETGIIEGYLRDLANSLTALATKYMLAGVISNKLPANLDVDQSHSGFPVFQEFLQMANDAAQVDRHLDGLPTIEKLKSEIVDYVLRERTLPRDLQFALSQRTYFEALHDRPLFLAQNHPQVAWLGKSKNETRQYLIHWAVYDSQQNLPNIYILGVEDSGGSDLVHDERRWPRVQSHLLAQSLSTLKLLTIATGFDKDFDHVHPKYLKRIYVGPMYSGTFTRQGDAIHSLLSEARSEPAQDWAFCWTTETLLSKRTKRTRTGLFGESVQEIYQIDHFDSEVFAAGATRVERAIILPHRPYQVLLDRDIARLEKMRRYVVGADDTILAAG